MKVTRVQNLSKDTFLKDFLVANKPVIVTDAMKDFDRDKFTPDFLRSEFGDELVQVYDDLFNLQTVDTLATYLNKNFDRKPEDGRALEYMRWYTKLKDTDFFWSDAVFEKLKPYWNHPYFVPNDKLVVPYCQAGETKNITDHRYPYKGLFVSGKGSRTRLHRDPFRSNAMLCQFYGEKKMYLYHPNKVNEVMNGKEFVDLMNVDHKKFPKFKDIEADYEDVLLPGEIVLFPSGWFHDVTCVSDSISITWNFLHEEELDNLYEFIDQYPNDDQLEILRFFLKDKIGPDAPASEIKAFYESNMNNNFEFIDL